MIGRLEQHSFRAMGTSCTVAATVGAGAGQRRAASRALAAAQAEIAACEEKLSRFDPLSDLSLLNASPGQWIAVDERLVLAASAALRARRETDGRFDPTILPALVAAGYDRTFDELSDRLPRAAPGWRAGARLEVDVETSTVWIETGASLDLGGIGKGFAAVRALDAMVSAAPDLRGGFVDLGGDVALRGAPPYGTTWRVGAADPRRPGEMLGTLELLEGGVATSGRDRRRFGPHGALHHLIDPSTGTPAEAGPLAVTVVAPDPAQAEGHATALAISTLDEAADHLARYPLLSALYVPAEGEPVAIGDLPFSADAVSGVAG